MPTKRSHINLAERNNATLSYLKEKLPDHVEWIATVAFYTALHLAESLFAERNMHCCDHGERERRLKERRFQKIYEHYFVLKNASMVARYLADDSGQSYTRFSDYLTAEKVETEILGHHLHQIMKSHAKLASQSATT